MNSVLRQKLFDLIFVKTCAVWSEMSRYRDILETVINLSDTQTAAADALKRLYREENIKNNGRNMGNFESLFLFLYSNEVFGQVNRVWAATWNAWKDGLTFPSQQAFARKQPLIVFVDAQEPLYELISYVTNQRSFDIDEFLVSCNIRNKAYVMTNKTLYMFGVDNPFPNPAVVVPLYDIYEYSFHDSLVVIKLHSGDIIKRPIVIAPSADTVIRFSGAARTKSGPAVLPR